DYPSVAAVLIICTIDKIRAPKVPIWCLLLQPRRDHLDIATPLIRQMPGKWPQLAGSMENMDEIENS
ncbi:MAG TPA: hypothetical protein VH592_21315, partial [Gemmataceae bacterium]